MAEQFLTSNSDMLLHELSKKLGKMAYFSKCDVISSDIIT